MIEKLSELKVYNGCQYRLVVQRLNEVIDVVNSLRESKCEKCINYAFFDNVQSLNKVSDAKE